MEPPKKYVRVDGIMKLNPEYTKFMAAQGDPVSSVPVPSQALPVVSSMDDHMRLNEASTSAGGKEIALADSTNATIDMLQEKDNATQVGLKPDDMIDRIGGVLQKYEVPIGLMNKLMMLTELDLLEFIVDDSGSMMCNTDSKNPKTGQVMSRWQEAGERLKEMMEVIAYVPSPTIAIRFLNRKDTIQMQRSGQAPEKFIADITQQIDRVFSVKPAGSTPAYEIIADSFQRHQGKSVGRYFFGDGVPNGGDAATKRIMDLAKLRTNPSMNPVTLLSCTNEDEDVEWMKVLEEVAPYVSEFDDYKDECREVLRDQGEALPYTRGFHLVGQLVAAMNPDDLDSMDESVPFTKYTLSNLLGVELNEQEYRHYFDKFQQAQRNRQVQDKADEVKKGMSWDAHFNEFKTQNLAKNIQVVKDFKTRLAAVVLSKA